MPSQIIGVNTKEQTIYGVVLKPAITNIKIIIATKGKLLIIVTIGFKNSLIFSFSPDIIPKINPITKLITKDINSESNVFKIFS